MNPKLTIIAEVDDSKRIDSFKSNVKAAHAGMQCELLLLYPEQEGDYRSKPEQLNDALTNAKGEIVHFTKTSCEYDANSISHVAEVLLGQDGISLACLDAMTKDADEKTLHSTPFVKKLKPTKPCIIDINKEPDHWCHVLTGLFIKRGAVLGRSFDTNLKYEYERAFLAELMSDYDKYYLLPDKAMIHGATDIDYYNYAPLYYKDWYLEELKTLAEILSERDDKNRINQRILQDFVKLQFSANIADRDKALLKGESFDNYISLVRDVLQSIDDDIITTAGRDVLPARVPPVMDREFLRLKHDCESIETKAVMVDDQYLYKDGFVGKKYDFITESGALLASSDMVDLNVRLINYTDDGLVVDAFLANAFFDDEKRFKVTIVSDSGEEIPVRRTKVYNLRKFFGVTVYHGYTVQFTLPLDTARRHEYVAKVEVGDAEFYPHWKFTKAQSRLNHQHENSFWEIKGRTLTYDKKRRKIVVRRSNAFSRIRNEVSYWRDILHHCKNRKRALSFIALRILYYVTRPYYGHKNIWMTFDQLFKGGDNGEYFYRYVSELKNKHQTIYYVVNKDTKEYKELSKKYKTVLDYSSLKHKLISLHTDIMFTTRASVLVYAGFAASAEGYFRGLYNFDPVCLQHGLSIQQIAQYQNRVYDNLKYYFCVSKYEIANLSKPIYGFDDKSVLRLTGAPRYDGLTGEAKRQIIITPTWRRNVTAGTNKKGSNHQYSVNFKHTKYFQIYNRLINDPKLIECAQRTGYKLIYLIHPILSPQLKDFDKNDVVDIVPGSKVNYEKILVESALMLTDHSGIMYDFAYQRKPLVYYHPDELPPQYAEGGLDYETMGFGPICKTHNQIVDELCKFMENDCKLDPKYAERIEDFFEFDDQNNCERVYQAALDFEKKYQS